MGGISNDQRLSEWPSPVWSGRCGEETGPPGMGTSAMRTQRRQPTGSSRIMGPVFRRIEHNHLHHCLREAIIPTGVSRRLNSLPFPYWRRDTSSMENFSNRNCGRRLSMQRGSPVKAARKNGPNVWQFRWSEKGGDGRRVYRKRVIGTIDQYSDAASGSAVSGPNHSAARSIASRSELKQTLYLLSRSFILFEQLKTINDTDITTSRLAR
jgi:hypothetical protein